ncbi:pyridoxal-dependent decarboxylase [Myxococcus llanfairpwllgwyngyllgogerychwyrndrobwllllantysiliogogogochensis]|uniref:Pyridoxal-dependent decarboxylase n=1 Tax=Myxococcus llanfairpwllgwyngyllgogerychwyrndrobwllllantysiliogogogochensis TaxID=2590453 RepID=A0A540WMV0_9BACT|nr:pyridoxal-dependent decarboxylase [Myxococcus llanfairpwllgwyngyllgogerychwyrndrobwllllantysiliogogogochensis]TQF10342.1 pyridoxal-dependent decarboxylase [Myxococcus llanfairpwllgwyngyllgogerychwyrndrobwllllantysiliogogogochensis]
MSLKNRLVGTAKRQMKQTLRPVLQRAMAPKRTEIPASYWGLEQRPGQGLCLEGVPLKALVERWGSPLHVVHMAALRRNVERFLAVPQGRAGGCEVFYSYKTNPIPGVLSVLHGMGVGAEIISAYELWLALKLGVAPERIVYNGPVKSEASVREAISRGIQLLAANHAEELGTFARIAAELGKRPRVALRVSTDSGWAAQFGTPIAGGAALRAYAQARASSHLDVVGLHAHRGATIRTEGEFTGFVEAVLAFTDTLHQELGLDLEVLDLGGSLCTPSVEHIAERDWRLNLTFFRDVPAPDPDGALGISRYVALAVELVESHYARRGRQRPRIFLEPGRAMTGDTQLLLGRVHTLKQGDDRTWAVLDAGVNHAECVRNEYHQLFHVDRPDAPASRVYTVVGPICTPGDTLYHAKRLPELTEGDTLAIMDAGAYFVPFATSFSYPQPAIIALDDGKERLLRRAETFEDQIALDTVTGAAATPSKTEAA